MLEIGPNTVPSPENGLIRCYNLFPSFFKNIDAMTAYLPKIAALGMNVVWINPVQLSGNVEIKKGNPFTGHNQNVTRSMYAMASTLMLDPRFSVVARDEEGDLLLTRQQVKDYKLAKKVDTKKLVKKIKRLREEIFAIQDSAEGSSSDHDDDEQNFFDPIDYNKIRKMIAKDDKANSVSKEELERELNDALLEQDACIQYFDTLAMQNFTHKAKELGISPIFDLVFNHLSKDAPFVADHPEFFNLRDTLYLDGTAFVYSKLQGKKASTSDVERSEILAKIPLIIEQFWAPFIHTYVNVYGFCGARVDCVKKVPKEVREPVYELIRSGVASQKVQRPVVILEEALFSDLTPEEFMRSVKNAGATHSTGSVYYKERLWHGGLPEDYSFEDFYKKSMVTNGVVNFTGNHDHYSCALTVCRELAFERLKSNPALYQACELQLSKTKSSATKDLVKSQFIHFYVRQILSELNNPDYHNDEVIRFGKALRDKMLTNILSGSGGYYMLSGDEYASFHLPTVFTRTNGDKLFPEVQLSIFDPRSPCYANGQVVLRNMAIELARAGKYKALFDTLSIANQEIFLSSFIEHLQNEINGNVTKLKAKFITQLELNLDQESKELDENALEEIPYPKTPENGWGRVESLEKFTAVGFFQEINHIVSQLPASQTGFWSELFKAVDDNILIALRRNGKGFDCGTTDMVIINLNPHRALTIDRKDIHKMALWLQKRLFPTCTLEPNPEWLNTEFHKAYGCVMGSAEFNQVPANLYFGGLLTLDSDVLEHTVEIDGQQRGFNIVVKPQLIKPFPLMLPEPPLFIQEEPPIIQKMIDTSLSDEGSSAVCFQFEALTLTPYIPKSCSALKNATLETCDLFPNKANK